MMAEIPDPAKLFGATVDELRNLMQHRGHEAYQMLQTDYGGVRELCKRLKTSPNEGRSPHDLSQNTTQYEGLRMLLSQNITQYEGLHALMDRSIIITPYGRTSRLWDLLVMSEVWVCGYCGRSWVHARPGQ